MITRIADHHCQICDEPTVLNGLGDGSVVCSCPSQRLFRAERHSEGAVLWVPVKDGAATPEGGLSAD